LVVSQFEFLPWPALHAIAIARRSDENEAAAVKTLAAASLSQSHPLPQSAAGRGL
jgi:hypothetical protein